MTKPTAILRVGMQMRHPRTQVPRYPEQKAPENLGARMQGKV